MEFCIDGEQLRKALTDIEAAEKSGFMHCLAVFRFYQTGRALDQNRAEYSDLCEKAHPTDGKLDWGRYQRVTKRNKFVDGKLVPVESANNALTGAADKPTGNGAE